MACAPSSGLRPVRTEPFQATLRSLRSRGTQSSCGAPCPDAPTDSTDVYPSSRALGESNPDHRLLDVFRCVRRSSRRRLLPRRRPPSAGTRSCRRAQRLPAPHPREGGSDMRSATGSLPPRGTAHPARGQAAPHSARTTHGAPAPRWPQPRPTPHAPPPQGPARGPPPRPSPAPAERASALSPWRRASATAERGHMLCIIR